MGQTTISVPEEIADELYRRKGRGESYADVIRRLLAKADAVDEGEAGAIDVDVGGTDQAPDAVGTERRETSTAPAERVRAGPPTDTPAVEDVDSDDLHALVDAIADDVLPGSGAKLDERREALHAVVDYLQERGAAEPKHFQRDVYPDHPARYTDADDPRRSWWKNAMYLGLRALADRSDAIEAADTTGEWTYRGAADR